MILKPSKKNYLKDPRKTEVNRFPKNLKKESNFCKRDWKNLNQEKNFWQNITPKIKPKKKRLMKKKNKPINKPE